MTLYHSYCCSHISSLLSNLDSIPDIYSAWAKDKKDFGKTWVTVTFFVFGTGEPGALEAHIRQLDKALDISRFQIQQTENIIRSKTPTGPELDSSYKGYVRVFWSTS